MFCYYQEETTEYNDYTRENEPIVMCNMIDKKCPYSKLKKAQRHCQYLKPIEGKSDD